MNSRNLIVGLVIVVLMLVGGGVFVLSFDKKAPPVPIEQVPLEEQVSLISPEEIGLSLTAFSDSKKVILEVANAEGLSGLDYELSYTSKGDIPRGVIGHIDIKKTQKLVSQEIVLGTCSDVCHYDQDVSNIKIILKITRTDGTVGQVEKSL